MKCRWKKMNKNSNLQIGEEGNQQPKKNKNSIAMTTLDNHGYPTLQLVGRKTEGKKEKKKNTKKFISTKNFKKSFHNHGYPTLELGGRKTEEKKEKKE